MVRLSLLDLAAIVVKYWKALTLHFVLASTVAVILSLFLTKYYRSELVFVPSGSSGSGLSSLLGDNFSADILGSSKLSKRQYSAILRSREVREKLIQKFDLVRVYKLHKTRYGLDLTLKALQKSIVIREEEEGGLGITDVISISIQVTDAKPARAADMANYLFDLMNEKAQELNAKEYRSVIDYLNLQISEAEEDLKNARSGLMAFQNENKIYDVSGQVALAMQTLGGYQAELTMLEKQKAYLLTSSSQENGVIRRINSEITVLRNKIAEMENRTTPDIIPGLRMSLGLSNKYVDLLKEVETYNQVRLLLRQQLELAKVRAARDYPQVYLIDRARPAQYKYKPKRAFFVLALVLSYMSIFFVVRFFLDYYKHLKVESPEKLEEYRRLWDSKVQRR